MQKIRRSAVSSPATKSRWAQRRRRVVVKCTIIIVIDKETSIKERKMAIIAHTAAIIPYPPWVHNINLFWTNVILLCVFYLIRSRYDPGAWLSHHIGTLLLFDTNIFVIIYDSILDIRRRDENIGEGIEL
jgi:hypothetical protein